MSIYLATLEVSETSITNTITEHSFIYMVHWDIMADPTSLSLTLITMRKGNIRLLGGWLHTNQPTHLSFMYAESNNVDSYGGYCVWPLRITNFVWVVWGAIESPWVRKLKMVFSIVSWTHISTVSKELGDNSSNCWNRSSRSDFPDSAGPITTTSSEHFIWN